MRSLLDEDFSKSLLFFSILENSHLIDFIRLLFAISVFLMRHYFSNSCIRSSCQVTRYLLLFQSFLIFYKN